MRAHFVRGIDPKDSMNIGNKHAREAQKLIAAFKEINQDLDSNIVDDFEPKMTDDKTTETFEMVVVTIKIPRTYALAWVNSGLEYYIASWGPGKTSNAGQDTYPKLEQAKKKIKEILNKEIREI